MRYKFNLKKIINILVLWTVVNNFNPSYLFSQDNPTLKETFKSDFLIGAALNNNQIFEKDSIGDSIVKEQFNSISPENALKWVNIHPRPDMYNFNPADKYVEFGLKNHMFIIGHTLVWHNQTPRWVFSKDTSIKSNLRTSKIEFTDRKTLLNRMYDHIQKVVGRYKGKINGWDVVNEALNEDGSLRDSPWMKIIGEEYIAKAFQYAHEADPEAELYYNDYSLENKPKRDGAIKLIKNLLTQGIKITGVGLQGHYKMDWPSSAQIDSTIKDFASLGLKVMITELDIDLLPNPGNNRTAEVTLNIIDKDKNLNPYKNSLPDSMQNSLADRYKEIFKVFVENKSSISRVTFWGVKDSDSWLNYWPVMGRTSYPLLFDRNGKPKPAYYKVLKTAENLKTPGE